MSEPAFSAAMRRALDWERHRLAVAGAGRFALLTAGGALALVGARLLSRPAGPDLFALLAVVAAAGALQASAVRRGVELKLPFSLASTLAVAASAAGAAAAASTGGFDGALAFGLVPLLWCWPAFMPGGVKLALPAVLGGLATHFVFLLALAGPPGGAAAGGLCAVLLVGAGASVATAARVERWRRCAGRASAYDALTHALTAPGFEERLTTLCAQRQRSLAPVTLVLLDVDRFRWVNDGHGLQTGDELLAVLATGLRADTRAGDFVGRCGPDEFAVVLDECEAVGALCVLERVRDKLKTPLQLGGAAVRVSFSAGIASAGPGEGPEPKALVRQARRALARSRRDALNATSVL